jgi:hypothetical protein
MERKVLAKEVEKEIKLARKKTLNLIESAFGDSPKWPFLRSQILKIFGTQGLGKCIDNNNPTHNYLDQ